MKLNLVDHKECNQILLDIIKEINPEEYKECINLRFFREGVQEYYLVVRFVRSIMKLKNKSYSIKSKFNLIAKSELLELHITQIESGWILFDWLTKEFKFMWRVSGFYSNIIIFELYEVESTWKY